ncbi:hypothetical protein E2C01_041695 [Portunus trituberculatus]|uniref:Uncharacterized protein n=1 Tax=Portunus trituberculatus TaxID=210409 RepID=A0A5B7FUE6_PORTR|nr:hypothetical protein [Portunus trituberculatus]
MYPHYIISLPKTHPLTSPLHHFTHTPHSLPHPATTNCASPQHTTPSPHTVTSRFTPLICLYCKICCVMGSKMLFRTSPVTRDGIFSYGSGQGLLRGSMQPCTKTLPSHPA